MMASGMAKYARMILRGVVTVVFLYAALTKLRNPHVFAHWGYSDAFAIFIGIAEIGGAIGLWIPKVARLAAIGLAIVMAGAIYTHLHNGEPREGVVPVLVLFALTRLIAQR
jgi:putative oxidoreductase